MIRVPSRWDTIDVETSAAVFSGRVAPKEPGRTVP